MTKQTGKPDGCCELPDLESRPLLSVRQAGKLAALFKVLANDTRLRLMHALAQAGEVRVTDLSRTLGMTPQAISNHLQRLSGLGILAARREGNNIYYRLVDLCVRSLLNQGLCMQEQLAGRGARRVTLSTNGDDRA